MSDTSNLLCGFCDKSQGEVRALIKGRPGNFICDECVAGCVEILAQVEFARRLKKALAGMVTQ